MEKCSQDKVQSFLPPFLELHLSEKSSSTFCHADLSNPGFDHFCVDRDQQTFIHLYESVTATVLESCRLFSYGCLPATHPPLRRLCCFTWHASIKDFILVAQKSSEQDGPISVTFTLTTSCQHLHSSLNRYPPGYQESVLLILQLFLLLIFFATSPPLLFLPPLSYNSNFQAQSLDSNAALSIFFSNQTLQLGSPLFFLLAIPFTTPVCFLI